MRDIYCVMSTGNLASDDARDLLLANSYELVRTRDRRKKFRTPDFEGVVKTDFRRQVLGGLSGILFEAEIEGEGIVGKLSITYILREADLRNLEESDDDIVWASLDEDPEDISPDRIRPSPLKKIRRAWRNN